MAPMSTPTRRPTWRGDVSGSPASRRVNRSGDVTSSVTMDPAGHPEKLPRPVCGIDSEAVYGSILQESPQEGCSPAGSPSPKNVTVAREKNAARQFLWLTQESVMMKADASSLPLPLAAVLAPFADSADCTSLPLSDVGAEEPLRCPRCRCYVNPHFRWSLRNAQKFECNMCGHNLDVPETFLEEMELNGQTADEDHHPELVFGSVDFTAEGFSDDRPTGSSVPLVCFAIETSAAAVASGFTPAVLDALEQAFDVEELPLERPVCFLTYDDEEVTFYAPTRSGRFRSVAMTDLDEPFLPLHMNQMLLDLADTEGQAMVLDMICNLRQVLCTGDSSSSATRTSGASSPSFCLEEESPASERRSSGRAALRLAVEALSGGAGGDVLLFQASSTWSASPKASASASPRKAPALPADASPKALPREELAADNFLEETRLACIRGGVAISCVTAPALPEHVDAAQLHWLPFRTGGDTLHLPSFSSASATLLTCQVGHWLKKMQASAYRCVVKLRCSKGLQCRDLVAPWPAAASSEDRSAFELPRISPDTSVAFILRPDYDAESDEDYRKERRYPCVQAAILYTNTKGERLLRTHTSSMGIATSVRQVFQHINIAPLMTVLLKQAATLALDQSSVAKPTLPGDFLLEFCLQVLSTYRRKCVDWASSSKALVIGRRLLLLPIYVLVARKLLYSVSSMEDKEQAEETLQRLLRMPIHSAMAALYPRVYPLPAPVHDGADLPRSSPAMEEQVSRGPSAAYLITNGLGIWYHQTGAGTPEGESDLRANAVKLAERIREELQPSPAWAPLVELSRLPDSLATPQAAGDESPSKGRPRFGSQSPSKGRTPGSGGRTPSACTSDSISWPEKVLLSTLFVEDEGVTEMSYAQWVEFLFEQVGLMLPPA
ncbi:unnamed protein product [Polarella glacialis]|uniref:Protein transport protein SEC23 n=1 Tax=Polarella glacialis TaxID=89957 RepID=A0A813DAC0_POLGL|nr:unnamed protein product [Polarella glacialis]